MADIVVITGLSGAGRSAAADVIEDLGWYVVDNLPTSLVEKVVELAALPGAAVPGSTASTGWRSSPGATTARCSTRSPRCAPAATRVTVLFLDASTPSSCAATTRPAGKPPARRPMPTGCSRRSSSSAQLLEADTRRRRPGDRHHRAQHAPAQGAVVAAFDDGGSTQMQMAVESFGFKHGLPLDADIVMDVRFLPNPHWDEALRPLTGHDPAVRDFVLERRRHVGRSSTPSRSCCAPCCRRYQAEGRSYLTIAIGCTGGRHRSVAVAEELAARLRARGTRRAHRATATSPADPSRLRTCSTGTHSERSRCEPLVIVKGHPTDDRPRWNQRLRPDRPQPLPGRQGSAVPTSTSSPSTTSVTSPTMAHLLKYDSVLGILPNKVKRHEDRHQGRR